MPIILVGLTPLQHLVLGQPLLRLLISSLQHWEAAGSNKVPWARVHRLCGRAEELLHPFWGGEMEPRFHFWNLTTVTAEVYGAASILKSQKLKWDRGKGFLPSLSSCPHGCPHAYFDRKAKMSELGGAEMLTVVEDGEHIGIHALTLSLHQGAPNPANLLENNSPLIPQHYILHSHSRPFFKILVWEDELRAC